MSYQKKGNSFNVLDQLARGIYYGHLEKSPPPLTFFEIPFYLLKSWRGQMTSNLSKLHTGIGDETRNLRYMFLFFSTLYTNGRM